MVHLRYMTKGFIERFKKFKFHVLHILLLYQVPIFLLLSFGVTSKVIFKSLVMFLYHKCFLFSKKWGACPACSPGYAGPEYVVYFYFFCFYFQICKEGSPSAVLIFKGSSITNINKFTRYKNLKLLTIYNKSLLVIWTMFKNCK